MPDLIIGHTTEGSSRIWVRGDKKSRTCDVSLQPPVSQQSSHLVLSANTGYTATVPFDGLERGIDYTVEATFSPSGIRVRGRLCTIRQPPADQPESFSFVLSSCNLSVVSINDFLARLVTTAGTALADSSLDLPVERWNAPPFNWMRLLAQWPLKGALRLIALAIGWFTSIKQPGPAYLRSPFLKLSAVFDSWVLEVVPPPPPSRTDFVDAENYEWFLAVGDCVESARGAIGVVASTDAFDDATRNPGRVVLTHVKGRFEQGDILFRRVTSKWDDTLRDLGTIGSVQRGPEWYDVPSFFLHAGDQIYYDFPDPGREPDHEAYRTAYREAWFEDHSLRHVLAHWPHYMTLDDHEIADQFALDFEVPATQVTPEIKPKQYLDEASIAYREYAHALSPPRQNNEPPPKDGPFWYTFDKGRTRFFVLDTRSQRNNHKAQIIDPSQMEHLLGWMNTYKDDLKFVVTSVPFVAEVNEQVSDKKPQWYKDAASTAEQDAETKRDGTETAAPKRNSEHDKWSAQRFKGQRDRIIEHIAANGIEHLVFLTGDMHCCYHATMRIGSGLKKYESITVHELAGGPVNQLQLATAAEFDRRSAKRTEGNCKKHHVDYEVTLERFHGEVSAVMHLKVEYKQREQVTGRGRDMVPEVEWSVIRTLTDPGPTGWSRVDDTTSSLAHVPSGPPRAESVMAGRICFVKRRFSKVLHPWPTAQPTRLAAKHGHEGAET